ncbi:MAG: translation initiation factor IF-2 [Candidatus Eisenbacteria bacterium]|uniref:Translation initiation factor IF-2 n=1 Tax=Eiseniibacteriota bacterium TaxID=2212470 RepID=A0A937X805_UNCEI|nr:translation initiation factor IF-2 [Candidatus Eisenbacteria bacterium]
MRKVRVYQLARELKITNEILLGLLGELGVEVANHAAAIDAEVAEQVRAHLGGSRPEAAASREAPARAAVRRAEAPAAATRAAAPAALWSLPSLPQAQDFALPTLQAAPPAPATLPPARPLGAVLPPREAGAALRPPETRTPAAAATRTYYPERRPAPVADSQRTDRRGPVPRKTRKKRKRPQVDEREVMDSIRRTIATIEGAPGRRRRKRRSEEDGGPDEGESAILRVSEYLTVAELAASMGVRPAEVVVACLRLGIVANINRRLDAMAIETVADEFGYAVELTTEVGEAMISHEGAEADEGGEETPRPVIVTVMGHVDHGKTKLLDFIRKADVVSSESGGITQHIGAYQVHLPTGTVTFLDTPGHEAFTAMRARGADVTDVVVLVVAADDRVNEQTVEAINHARAARKQIVVAVNKCDLANADPGRIKKELADQGLLVEEWGGQVIAVEISAKFGQNVDKLLEMLVLVAEMLDLKAVVDRPARGTVIEARKDPGRGIVGAVLVQSGTLRIGDSFVCGVVHGKVRALVNDRGERVESAGPATPVEVLGWSEVPQVADTFAAVKSDAVARAISVERTQIARQHRMKLAAHRFRLDDLHRRIQEGKRADLRVILRADVQGSAEVIRDSFEKLTNEQVNVAVIHAGVGKITESDVLLAATSNAMIVGFHVRPEPRATQLAQSEGVEIRLYKIIYEAIDQVKAAMVGLLAPKQEERVLGTAEVREIFRVPKAGTVAGSHVLTGKVVRSGAARLIRGADVLWTGKIGTLRRFKDDAREVLSGFDCGITLDGFDEIQVGDQIETFVIEDVAPTAQ